MCVLCTILNLVCPLILVRDLLNLVYYSNFKCTLNLVSTPTNFSIVRLIFVVRVTNGRYGILIRLLRGRTSPRARKSRI